MNEPNPAVRRLQIDMIADTPNPIIEWFDDLWNKLTVIHMNVYHTKGGEYIYYLNDGYDNQWIFYRDDNTNVFYCNWFEVWRVLGTRFSLDYNDEVPVVVQMLIENKLGIPIITPYSDENTIFYTVEESLKKNITSAPL